MGSPFYCYRRFMIHYIYANVRWTKYEKMYTDGYLQSLSDEELENLVKKFNKSHKMYAAYLGGIAVSNAIDEWRDSCDMMNACGCAIGDFMDLLDISEPDELDFEELF